MIDQTLGFIGAGRMATALARGVVRVGLIAPEKIIASDASSQALTQFENSVPGAQTTDSNTIAAGQADLLVLAVKPQVMGAVLAELRSAIPATTLIASIAAGVTLSRLTKSLKKNTRVIRVMPNTPCLVGRGASAYSLGDHASADDAKLVEQVLSSVGDAYRVPESQLDAVTGLSGSGPAFVYTTIEALTDAGVLQGLPRATAARLAAQTVAGAAEMVLSTGKHPAVLRDEVTSPGGTTAAGLAALDRCGLRNALTEAVAAATERSRQLGQLE